MCHYRDARERRSHKARSQSGIAIAYMTVVERNLNFQAARLTDAGNRHVAASALDGSCGDVRMATWFR